MAVVIRWREGYQPLVSIDSVSGEIKSISPFKPLRQLTRGSGIWRPIVGVIGVACLAAALAQGNNSVLVSALVIMAIVGIVLLFIVAKRWLEQRDRDRDRDKNRDQLSAAELSGAQPSSEDLKRDDGRNYGLSKGNDSSYNRKDQGCNWDEGKHQAVASQMFYRVINSQSDYEECRSFRTKLAGGAVGDWAGHATATTSALDQMKVNSQDIFAYFTLQFQSARQVLDNTVLSQLELCDDAIQAARAGSFREKYGDMVVVGYVTGGEAEAALRVSKFSSGKRNELKVALEASFTATGDASLGGATGDVAQEEMTASLLQDCSCTVFSNRRGVTNNDQKVNPSKWGSLLRVLELGAKNEGEKIAAVCYKMDLFPQIPKDLLGFKTMMVEQNTRILQSQFALLAFVKNSCEAILEAVGNKDIVDLPINIKKQIERLKSEAMSGETLFLKYTDSHQVEQLQGGDPATYMGQKLMDEWNKIEMLEKWKVHTQSTAEINRALSTFQRDRFPKPSERSAPVMNLPAPIPLNPDDSVRLTIRIGGAKNLPDAMFGLSEFYINVIVQGQKLRTPTVKRASTQCEWSHTLPMIVLRSPWQNLIAEIELKTENLVGSTVVGIITVPMSQVPRGPVVSSHGQAQSNQGGWQAGLGGTSNIGEIQRVMSEGGDSTINDRNSMRTWALSKPDGKAGTRGDLSMTLRLEALPRHE